MPKHDFERKLVVILSADVAGYSRLMGEDESGTLARLNVFVRICSIPKPSSTEGELLNW